MSEQTFHVGYKHWEFDISSDYQEKGEYGVLCLHGLQSNKKAFSDVIELCSQRGLSSLAMDFIGFGESSKPKDFTYELEDQTAIVEEVIAQSRLRKFFLIGHSMGGMVGTLLLGKLKERLLGFVNMEGNFVLADCGASLPVSEATFEEFSKNLYPALKRSLDTSKEPSAAQRRQWLESTPDYAFYGASRSIVEWSRSEKLASLFVESSVRKLFVFGEQNRRKRDVLQAAVPSAEIPHAGHFMLADNPKETLRVIGEFLGS